MDEGTCAVTCGGQHQQRCSDLNVAELGVEAFFQLEKKGRGLRSFSPTSGYLMVGPQADACRLSQGYGGRSLIQAIVAEQGGARARRVKEATWEVKSLGIYGIRSTQWAVLRESKCLVQEWRLWTFCSAPTPASPSPYLKSPPHQPCQCDINGLTLISQSSSI